MKLILVYQKKKFLKKVNQKIKTDENVYNFCPQLKGKLLEINQNLAKNPQLLVESPEKNGFICLIQQEPKRLT